MMIKLKHLLKEIDEEEIDQQRLFWNSLYLSDVAEKLGYDDDFNKLFWEYPQTLYHCTNRENYELIKKDGMIKQKYDNRGISNRNVGDAVFTTRESEEIPFFKSYYGPIVLAINTIQMKKDGYTPEVEMEPDWAEAYKLAYVFTKIENKDVEAARFVDSSDQNTEWTVIVYGNIPIKYVTVEEYD